jgi:hypothetical protein
MKIGWPDGWRDGIDSLQSQSVVEYESIEGVVQSCARLNQQRAD